MLFPYHKIIVRMSRKDKKRLKNIKKGVDKVRKMHYIIYRKKNKASTSEAKKRREDEKVD